MCCAHSGMSPGGVLFSKNLIMAREVVGKFRMSPGDGCWREDEMSTVQFSSGRHRQLWRREKAFLRGYCWLPDEQDVPLNGKL